MINEELKKEIFEVDEEEDLDQGIEQDNVDDGEDIEIIEAGEEDDKEE